LLQKITIQVFYLKPAFRKRAWFSNLLAALTAGAASFLVFHQKDTADDVFKRPDKLSN